MIDRRQMVIELRRVSRELTLYDLYLRTIYLKSYEPAREYIEAHFTGVEQTVDILIEGMDELDEALIDYGWRVMINGELLDRSGKDIEKVAKKAALELYRASLESMYMNPSRV
jgi:hypothetical protein